MWITCKGGNELRLLATKFLGTRPSAVGNKICLAYRELAHHARLEIMNCFLRVEQEAIGGKPRHENATVALRLKL
jgi:hypothetical protein